jgi:hypothetical protein
MTCLALLIPGAAVASANSTSSSYTSNSTGHKVDNKAAPSHKVDNKSASRTPKTSTKTTSPATSTTSPSSVQAANASRTVSTGSLPFTGLDDGALAGGAVVLLGAGLMLRRASTTDRK